MKRMMALAGAGLAAGALLALTAGGCKSSGTDVAADSARPLPGGPAANGAPILPQGGGATGPTATATGMPNAGTAAPAMTGGTPAAPGATAANAPYGASMGGPYAGSVASQPSGKDAQVDKLKAEAARLEGQAKAKPGDAALKNKAADADYQAGYASMMSPNLDRKLKYRQALEYYRKALALNPSHADAKSNKDLIEGIYRQMGRPIPQ